MVNSAMTNYLLAALALIATLLLGPDEVRAQEPDGIDVRYTVATVTRAPFSMEVNGTDTGFAIDLWDALATRLNIDYDIVRYDTFRGMLDAVQNGDADIAIANISITSERERVVDFTQPIFESGLQIMLTEETGSSLSFLRALLRPQLFLFAFGAIALLIGMGMLMWLFERKRHDYFAPTAKEAVFPAFWWALNLIISGGYEEKMPMSRMGRVFGVMMVVASLFVVSVFVANITATMTIDALSDDVQNLNDLDGQLVGTTEGSTTSSYLDQRGIGHRGYGDFADLTDAFERGELDAVVFDGPILAYYVQNSAPEGTRLVPRVFKRESYGIAVSPESALREPLDRALLRLREGGDYDALIADWFGPAYSDR